MQLIPRSKAAFVAAVIFFVSTLGLSEELPRNQLVVDDSGSFLQPDYSCWKKISRNMTEADVEKILGSPVFRSKHEPLFQEMAKKLAPAFLNKLGYDWTYGWLRFSNAAVPHTYRFNLTFKDGRVRSISDPFGGVFSEVGAPTIPALLTPRDEASMSHYPCFVDLRWNPSSGVYPIKYHVEVDFASDTIEAGQRTGTYTSQVRTVVDAPVYSFTFVGMNKGRWRVKARNSVGDSKWTEYRHFKFIAR